ncbi:ABC transporter permease [Sulfurospirillum arcachonense]|uniref:ABC transporter permease n=1 Tax=Sulfurospirillum arcachonense TaxID=57666 RepID=UPI0006873041|nr:ABC transporter permease [Sulfurospirillum arcachonense]
MMKLFKNELLIEYFEDKLAVVGLFVFTLLCIFALAPAIFSPQNPYDLAQLFLENSFQGPNQNFLLGTDEQGRDILSAIMYGLRVSLYVGLASTILSVIIGFSLGLISGYYGGWVDTIIMRIADIQLSFPAILIALIIMALWGAGIGKIIIAITIVNWVYYARTARGVVLSEKEKDYAQSAKALGMRNFAIIFREIMPNVTAPIIVIATVRIANAIILEATLSFLGLGVPITEPSLGSLIANGYQVLFSGYWWTSVFPGIILMVLIISINLIGDRTRDIMNPRLKR